MKLARSMAVEVRDVRVLARCGRFAPRADFDFAQDEYCKQGNRLVVRGSSKRYFEEEISAGVQLPASPAIVFIAQPRRWRLLTLK